jgi:hypothetical protein
LATQFQGDSNSNSNGNSNSNNNNKNKNQIAQNNVSVVLPSRPPQVNQQPRLQTLYWEQFHAREGALLPHAKAGSFKYRGFDCPLQAIRSISANGPCQT